MIRTQAIAMIEPALPPLDDASISTVAEIVKDMATGHSLPRQLTARELALIEQSKDDFKHGRPLTIEEARVRSDALLAQRRSLRAKA
jgi:hypothetical protein